MSTIIAPRQLAPSPTTGALLTANTATTDEWLGIGSAGQFLGISAGLPAWSAPPSLSAQGLAAGAGISVTAPGTIANTGVLSITGTSSQIATSASTGAVTLSFPSTVDITTLNLTNALGTTFGGTGLTAWAPGQIPYASATNVLSGLAIGSSGQVLTVAGGVPTWAAPATAGTVTSVGMSVPAFLSVTPTSITSSGSFALSLANQTANAGFFGPASGAAAAPTFRAMVPLDWAASAATGAFPYASSGTANAWLGIGTTAAPLVVKSGLPAWASYTLPTSVATGDLWYGSATNVKSALGIGTNGYFLKVVGGIPAWAAAPTTSPAGSNSQVQFNSSGAFGADAGLTYGGQSSSGSLLTVSPTNTAATAFNAALPASFTGVDFQTIDSSGNQIFTVDQVPAGESFVRIAPISSTSQSASYLQVGSAGYNSSGYFLGGLIAASDNAGLGIRSAAQAAMIVFVAAQNQSSGNLGTDISFRTSPLNSSTLATYQLFSANGNTVLNATGSALATSFTNGATYIPSCAGSPTGTPTHYSGAVPIVYDTTNKHLWIYNGSSWEAH